MNQYLSLIQKALDEALYEAGDYPAAENLVSHLSERGLLIVEVPVGIHHDFRGVPDAAEL